MDLVEVATGSILAVRLFDVAFAIDLGKAEDTWARTVRTESSRGRLTTTPPKAVAFGVPPVAIGLGFTTLTLPNGPVQATATARLYDFGVVSLILRVSVACLSWDEFSQRVNEVDLAVGLTPAIPMWTELLDRVRRGVGDALIRPTRATLEEDYLVGIANTFSERLTAEALLDRLDLVPMLSGENRPLSDGARRDLLRHRYSFYTDDLVVLTWDRAFIYEPRGDTDVIDVLEVANAQLLEMRYYDEKLDAELPRMYEQVERASRGLNVLAARRYAGLARQLYTMVAEVTELTEQVDNALQVTEDVYLARVYAAALELFRVRLVTSAVNRKLAIIRDTYSALYDKAASSRSAIMEAAILLLIAVELVLALLRR